MNNKCTVVVNDFKWEKGVNDIEYIKLLEQLVQHQKETIGNAIKKLHEKNYYEIAWEELKQVTSVKRMEKFNVDSMLDIKEIEKKYNLGGNYESK